MVTDWHKERFPDPKKWTLPQYDEFKKIIEELKKVDEKLGQPDCPSDEKQEFLKKLADVFKDYEIKRK
jgi:hypothetical protein